jgi:hypothetical protein
MHAATFGWLASVWSPWSAVTVVMVDNNSEINRSHVLPASYPSAQGVQVPAHNRAASTYRHSHPVTELDALGPHPSGEFDQTFQFHFYDGDVTARCDVERN